MPKMKTHKATVKRLHVTGSGRVMHKRAGASHMLMRKSAARKRRLAIPAEFSSRDVKRMLKLIAPGGLL
jgi:large subunit ribosomal protein L35